MKNSPLLTKINDYEIWRNKLEKTVSDYRDWLARSPHTDSIKELRLHDMLESIHHDQLVITFLADESRGKTETINALFFPDLDFSFFPRREGESSICSTEVYWNQDEDPCIKLLPISTRRSEDTLAYLKTTPNVWQTYKLEIDNPTQVQSTLSKLSEQLDVTQSEAFSLGLWDENDPLMAESVEKTGRIKVPVWRHAIINYPHPALKSGLVVIDTPGLDKLSSEPELMLNNIPNSNAAVFLTATDTGVTPKDITIWNEFIKNKLKHKYILLNKIDVLWERHNSEQSLENAINSRVTMTAHQLHTTPDIVFPISAQEAHKAKLNYDGTLLNKSALPQFEKTIGQELIESKHIDLGKNIAQECSVMVKNSRKIMQQRRISLRSQVEELKALKGKNQDEAQAMLKKVVLQKKKYEASIPTFNLANEKITKHGKVLLKHLSSTYLDSSIKSSRKEIGDSWTTVGLNRGMRNLMKQANDLATYVTQEGKKIKKLADNVYDVFQSKHGFEIFEAPELDMSNFLSNMRELEKVTDDFCRDPINVMTEKHFLVRKFFLGLGTRKQKIFDQARKECEHWLLDVLSTLKSQMAEHKAMLTQRTQNLMKANDSAKALEAQLIAVQKEYDQLNTESKAMDEMLLNLMSAMQPAHKAEAAENTLNLPELTFVTPEANQSTSANAA